MRPSFSRPYVRLAKLAGWTLALMLALPWTSPSMAQESFGDLARYVPKDNLTFYFEYDGLDAHADAWKKTAAYKILNNTPTGAMLEEVATQIINKLQPKTVKTPRSGAEIVAMVKHIARSGFLVAQVDNPQTPGKSQGIMVFRNVFKDKTIRPIVARNIQDLNAPNTKPQSVVRAGHKIVSGVTTTGGAYAWWIEESKKEDLVYVFPGAEAADVFLETLDRKRPSAVDHPRRAELVKPANGLIPTGLMFVDSRAFLTGTLWAAMGLKNINTLDLRWGFQDDALMTTVRITTTGPRQGVLGLFDGPTFDKAKLPPIPSSVNEFAIFSLDLKTTYEKLIELAKNFKPDADAQVARTLDAIKGKSKLKLKEDILAHLGPKVSWYVLPAKVSSAPAPSGFSMASMMMTAAGLDQIPKLAIVFDLNEPATFTKALDETMSLVNRELKAQAAKPLGEAVQPKGKGSRGPSVPSFEFRLIAGETKMYVLQVPPELAGQIPAALRPAIRVGPKHVVLAVSPDVARLALEAKTNYTPSSELATGLQGLSSKLKMLVVVDPRETLPGILASLPAKLQTGINTVLLLRSGAAGVPGISGPGGVPGGAPSVTSPVPNAGAMGSGSASASPGALNGSASAGAPKVPGAPGSSGQPVAPTTLVLQIEPSKVPSADSIKGFLFPSIYSVEVLDDEIRISVREAFPSLIDPSKLSAIASMMPSIMGGSGMIPAGAMPPPGAVPPPGGGKPPAAGTSTVPLN